MASGGRAALLRRVALLERQQGSLAPMSPGNPFEFMQTFVPDIDAIDRELMPQRAKRSVLVEVRRAVAGGVALQQLSDEALDYLIELFFAMARDAGMHEEELQLLRDDA